MMTFEYNDEPSLALRYFTSNLFLSKDKLKCPLKQCELLDEKCLEPIQSDKLQMMNDFGFILKVK